MTLLQIVLATLAGGLLSLLAAAALSFSVLARWMPRLLSYAVGLLLGAAFLNLLPEAVNRIGAEEALATCLAGVLGFFALEKFALWRHAHAHGQAAGGGAPPVKASGALILVGDGLHNFVDGILLAAAFVADPALGWAVAIGIIAHEVPQEVGDFAVLLEAGYTRRRALALNALASLAAVAGGVLGYAALGAAEGAIPYVLAVSAASFLYIAVADLIPELHRHWTPRAAGLQAGLILAGVGTLWLAHSH
jgi:zinc and cadmium transporter